MTVTYIQYVPTAGKVGSFFRLLLLWRGGVLKGIWRDLVIYCILYTAISVGYRYGISQNEELKLNFERMCVYFGKNGDYIPLSFILGFYVTQVVTRWWGQFNSLAWPDSLAMNLLTYMPGSGKPRRLRRLIMRWVNLANILTLRRLSTEIARRFPSFEHLVESRLLTARELSKLNTVLETSDSLYPVHWVPLQWAQVELRKAKDDGHISSDLLLTKLHESIQELEMRNKSLIGYGWMNIPLVYTQLVTIAVHIYFLVTLLGRQYLTPTRYIGANGDFVKVPPGTPNTVNLVGHDDSVLDFYIPFFTILQFIFYFGWLKVAEILINPFGDDDDDFDVNFIIDRNFQTSYLMVEGNHKDHIWEKLEDDTFGDDIPPTTLPHTTESFKFKEPPPTLPTDNFEVHEDKSESNEELNENSLLGRKLSIKSGSMNWYKRRVSLRSEILDKSKRFKCKRQSLHIPRSFSKSSSEDKTSPIIVIHEDTPAKEELNDEKNKNFFILKSDWEETDDADNTDGKHI